MKNRLSFTFETDLGPFTAVSDGRFLKELRYGRGGGTETRDPVLTETARQVREYISGVRRDFDLPIAPEGTEFMKKVWRVLRRIPYGEVLTYGEVAEEAGSPRSARAVGGAVGRNPLLLIVPCHRVVARDGLGGFSSEGGLDLKRKLLEIEKNAGDF